MAFTAPLSRPLHRAVLVCRSLLVEPRRGLLQPLELVVLRNVDERLQEFREGLLAVTRSILPGARAACIISPPPAARSFEKRCGQLRRLPERIRVREGELRAGSVIVAFDILPEPHDDQPDRSAEHEEVAASKHTTVAIVATLQALIRDAAGLPQPADDPQYQMMTPLLSRLDPDHKLIARTSPAHAHEYARANPRWIDDEVCLCVSNEQALFELFQR